MSSFSDALTWPFSQSDRSDSAPVAEPAPTAAQGRDVARPASSRQRRRRQASLLTQDLGPLQTMGGSLLGA